MTLLPTSAEAVPRSMVQCGVCDELSIDHLLNPEQFTITKIHPNPFNPTTAIHFSLSYMTKVKLSIYNLKGQELYTLINKVMSKGEHVVKWNADSFSSGVYFVKMTSANNKSIKKILLIK